MILYIKNPKDFTKNLLETINRYNKVAGYKLNVQKSAAFLYTNNEISEEEVGKTIDSPCHEGSCDSDTTSELK